MLRLKCVYGPSRMLLSSRIIRSIPRIPIRATHTNPAIKPDVIPFSHKFGQFYGDMLIGSAVIGGIGGCAIGCFCAYQWNKPALDSAIIVASCTVQGMFYTPCTLVLQTICCVPMMIYGANYYFYRQMDYNKCAKTPDP